MKSYPQLISRLFNTPLLITQAKHRAICQVLEAHLSGNIKATLGRRLDDNPDLDLEGTPCDCPTPPDFRPDGADIVIPVHGILGKHLGWMAMESGGCDLDTVSDMVDVALADTRVQRMIFDFRSPGGSATGVPELGRKIAAITSKKTIAFTDSDCDSGAIWLAEQCQEFYCTPSSTVGSIGVWCAYWDLSESLQKAGERMQAISAGKYKLLGAYWKPLTDEEKAMLQASVDKLHAEFKDAVNLRREVADKYMQGQTFDGEEALEAGLVDGLVESLNDLLSD